MDPPIDQGDQGGQPSQDTRPHGYPFGPRDPVRPDADAPRGNRFNYQPSQRRPPDQWGEPDDHLRFAQGYGSVVPGPYWPQIDQIPRLLGSGPTSLQGLMQISSINGQRNSLATMSAMVAYLKAKQAAQGEEPRRESEQLKLSLEKQTADLNAESRDYHDVLARKNLSPAQRRQALYNIALKYNDQNLRVTIESGDMEGAEKMLGERDARSLDYQKMIQSMDAHQREEDAHKAAEEKYNDKENERKNRLDPLQHEPSTYDPPSVGTYTAPGTTPTPDAGDGTSTGAGAAAAPAPGAEGTGPAAAPAAPADTPPAMNMPGLTQASPQQDAPQIAQAGNRAGGPMQYPQTAMAGDTMSDAPPIGMRPGNQTAQAAPDPYQQGRQQELANSPALTSGATGPYRMVNRPQVDQDAQDMVMGTSKMTSKTNPEEFPVAQARADEIKRRLADIANNPRLTPQQALDEVRKVLPPFADQLMGYVGGQTPVPFGTAARPNPMVPFIAALGKKIDPTFDQNQLKNRAALWKSVFIGPDARQQRAQLTGLDHLDWGQAVSSQVGYLEGKGPTLNWLYQEYLKRAPEDWQKPEEIRQRNFLMTYAATIKAIAPEVVRAQKGSSGTLAENTDMAELLGPATPPAVRDMMIASFQHLIWQREKNYLTSMAKSLNLTPDQLLQRIGHGFDNPNMQFAPDKASDGSPGNTPTELLLPHTRAQIAYDVLHKQPPPVPGLAPELQDALEWMENNPDDPRYQTVLKSYMEKIRGAVRP